MFKNTFTTKVKSQTTSNSISKQNLPQLLITCSSPKLYFLEKQIHLHSLLHLIYWNFHALNRLKCVLRCSKKPQVTKENKESSFLWHSSIPIYTKSSYFYCMGQFNPLIQLGKVTLILVRHSLHSSCFCSHFFPFDRKVNYKKLCMQINQFNKSNFSQLWPVWWAIYALTFNIN